LNRAIHNDAAARLKLGALNGGVETDGVATMRPCGSPNHVTLTSGVFAAALTVPDATHTSFQIDIDGYRPDTVSLGTTVVAGAPVVASQLADLAACIQRAVE